VDGIHDMGGMEGFGPVPYAAAGATKVTTRWEAFSGAALFALLRSGLTNLDAHRHRIERIDPTRYLPITYWGRWLAAVESAAVDQGVVSQAEIDDRLRAGGHDPARSAPPRMRPVTALESRDNAPGFIRPVEAEPRFRVGDQVRTLAHAPQTGHHRLPRYCRGRAGEVARVYPAFTLPDTMAHGRGEHPTFVYAVGFAATELWGPAADQAQRVHLDLFEPYLLPA
jgi:nitrile hydratase